MKILVDKDDLRKVLKAVLEDQQVLDVEAVEEDEIVFQLIRPKSVQIKLRRFLLVRNRLSAEITPWWVRSLLKLALRFKRDIPIEFDNNRVVIEIPEDIREQFEMVSFHVETGVIIIEGFPVLDHEAVS